MAETKKSGKGDKKGSLFMGLPLVLGSALLAVILSVLTFFDGLESRLYDLNFKRRGSLPIDSCQVCIVAIDQMTLEALSFPFDRVNYATLIDNLKALGAKLIVFDIDFSSVGAIPSSDSVMFESIKRAGIVVLDGGISRRYVAGFEKPLTKIKVPSPAIAPEGTPWGLINDLVDADGVTRRYPLFLIQDTTAYLSLGLKAYQLANNINSNQMQFNVAGSMIFGDLRIPKSLEGSSTMLNYHGQAAHFPTYPFISVINGDYNFSDMLSGLSPEEIELLKASGMSDIFKESPFQDKIVLIGASADDLQDNKFTPYYSGEKPFLTPGVEVHANALQMLYDSRFLRYVDYSIILAGVLALSLLVWFMGRWLPQWLNFVGTALLIGGIAVLSYSLFANSGLILRQMPLMLSVLIAFPTNLVYHIILTQKEKALIRGMFAQYVPKEVTDALINNPELAKLGGEKRRMSVLFTDVAGFTTISEGLSPEELVHLLNEYLTAMTTIILQNKGIIDKYEGDLIMAEFGAPVWFDDHATQCCRASLLMQKKLAEMRLVWKEQGQHELYSRVGVNTGDMLVGNMGSTQVFDYTVMGDAVNLSSRLEGANKNYGTTIMIGKETWKDVHDKFVTRPLDLLRVKGKKLPVEVFELLSELMSELSPGKQTALKLYQEGWELYSARDFRAAAEKFGEALNADPHDGPSQVYHDRAAAYYMEPPPPDWDGVWELTEK